KSVTPRVDLDTPLKIGFVSLGCPKNLVDSEVMMGLLVANGHELTPHPDQAGIHRRDHRDGGVQEGGPREKTDCGGLPGGALPRRYPQGSAGSGRPRG